MPGVNVKFTNAPAPTSRPSESGKLFVVGQTERGSTTSAIVCKSLAQFNAKCGEAVTGSYLKSGIEEFFQEGGSTVIVGRQVGSAAVAASVVIKTSGAVNIFTVKAKSVGSWGNNLKVKFAEEEAGVWSITVLFKGEQVEKKGGFKTVKAAVEWSAESEYVTITETAEGIPNLIESTLTAGADGTATTTAAVEAALKLFPKDLGCGQIAAFGNTTTAVQEALLAHAEKYDRFALIDLAAAGATAAELKTAANTLKNKEGARRGAGFSSWATIPGLTPNTTRQVPWSAVQAGILARNDSVANPPRVNEASAGINGRTRNVLSITEFDRSTRDELYEAKVNPIRNIPVTGIETYGNVTLVGTSQNEPAWEAISASRLFMFVAAEGEALLEKLVFGELDSHHTLQNRAHSLLTNFLESLGNQLFNNAAEAVETGDAVNTPETIKRKELNASVEVQPSPSADTVTLNLTAQTV